MTTPLVEASKVKHDANNPYRVAKHLRRKIRRQVASHELSNGSHVRSMRFNALTSLSKKIVRKKLEGYTVTVRASGHQYRVVWDTLREGFVLINNN